MKKENSERHEKAEETLLDSIQAGLGLIGFGFGISGIVAMLKTEMHKDFLIILLSAIGGLLILAGVISIILATIQFKHKVRCIKRDDHYKSKFSLPLLIAMMISFLGLAAFVAVVITTFFLHHF